jgi:hypothetical protein
MYMYICIYIILYIRRYIYAFVSCTHIAYLFFVCFPPYIYRLVYYSLHIERITHTHTYTHTHIHTHRVS